MSVSIDPVLGDDIRAAAERAGLSVSAWLAQAAAARLRWEALTEFLSDWQSEHGAITPAELAKARAELGHPARRKRVA